MSMSVAVSPFVPRLRRVATVPRRSPPRAERAEAVARLSRRRQGCAAERGADRSPRGNGKTALLRWFQRDIESGENDIDVIWLTPSEIPGLDILATELVPPGRFSSLRPETPLVLGRHRAPGLGAGRPAKVPDQTARRALQPATAGRPPGRGPEPEPPGWSRPAQCEPVRGRRLALSAGDGRHPGASGPPRHPARHLLESGQADWRRPAGRGCRCRGSGEPAGRAESLDHLREHGIGASRRGEPVLPLLSCNCGEMRCGTPRPALVPPASTTP